MVGTSLAHVEKTQIFLTQKDRLVDSRDCTVGAVCDRAYSLGSGGINETNTTYLFGFTTELYSYLGSGNRSNRRNCERSIRSSATRRRSQSYPNGHRHCSNCRY